MSEVKAVLKTSNILPANAATLSKRMSEGLPAFNIERYKSRGKEHGTNMRDILACSMVGRSYSLIFITDVAPSQLVHKRNTSCFVFHILRVF